MEAISLAVADYRPKFETYVESVVSTRLLTVSCHGSIVIFMGEMPGELFQSLIKNKILKWLELEVWFSNIHAWNINSRVSDVTFNCGSTIKYIFTNAPFRINIVAKHYIHMYGKSKVKPSN